MKMKTMLMFLAAALVTASGCLPGEQVEGVFVSGHLGNYMDCPGDGYSEGSSSETANRGAPSGDVAACEDGEDCYTPPLNCEDAQVTIRLANDGEFPVELLQVERIELVDHSGTVQATLPLMDTVDTESNEPFDGMLEPGEEVNLRVDFQGPSRLSDFVKSEDNSAYIRLRITADEHRPLTIDSDELYVLPSVVT